MRFVLRSLYILTWIVCLDCAKAAISESLVRANNSFAIDLYKSIEISGSNLVISPFSVSASLALTYAGAREETARQIASALRWPKTTGDMSAEFGALLSTVKEGGEAGHEMTFALGLFVERSCPGAWNQAR